MSYLLVLSILCLRALAGSVPLGGTCSSSTNHLDPNTQNLVSQCTEQTYCTQSTNGTCAARLCRRDQFPFGFVQADTLPPLCPPASFCPDEGSGCRGLVGMGDGCQVQRDEQCAPPADWEALGGATNFNGSVCLKGVCMYANATLGGPCVLDSTTYNIIDLNGQRATNVVTRDNCHAPLLYCDAGRMVCARSRALGAACAADQECETRTCGARGACVDPPETPLRVAPWQYAATAVCVVGAMAATCVLLTLVHKRHRHERYKELREYYCEQVGLRRSIIALHSAAADYGYLDEKHGMGG